MRNGLFVISSMFLGVLFMQCKHTPVPAPEKVVVAPRNDSICFSDRVLPLFTSTCAQSGCHDNSTRQSNIDLSSYPHTISTISGNLLVQVIQDPSSHTTAGYPQLSSGEVQLLVNWVNEGMKNSVNCVPCDSSNVTFSGTVNPIIQNYCISCHSTTGTILATYNDVKVTVDNGKFLCTVEQTDITCQTMPQNLPKLSNCNINEIKKWIAAGAPNN
jgi:hypothetical protein